MKLLDESSLRKTPCSSSRATTAAWAATARRADEEQQHRRQLPLRSGKGSHYECGTACPSMCATSPATIAPGTTCAVPGSTSTCIRPSSRTPREAAGVAGVDGESLLRCSPFPRRSSGARRFSSISRATSARARILACAPPPPPPHILLSNPHPPRKPPPTTYPQVTRGRSARASTTLRDDIGEAKNHATENA